MKEFPSFHQILLRGAKNALAIITHTSEPEPENGVSRSSALSERRDKRYSERDVNIR